MTDDLSRKAIRFSALFVPTLLLAVFVSFNLYDLSRAPIVRLPIAGYDPVHILYGHYISFSFDRSSFTNSASLYSPDGKKAASCLCFRFDKEAGSHPSAHGEFVQCAKKENYQCDVWADNTAAFDGQQKYFVDEQYAEQLDRVVRQLLRPARRQQSNGSVAIGAVPNPALVDPQRPVEEQPVPVAERALPRVTIDVSVSSRGIVRYKMLNIDGRPWLESFHQ